MVVDILNWAALIAWLIIAMVFFTDSWIVHGRTVREVRAAESVGGGRALVANRRQRISFWFLVGSGSGLLTGIVAFWRAVAFHVTSIEYDVLGIVIRVLIVSMFFSLWRAKRNNRILYTEARDLHTRELRQAQTNRYDAAAARDAVRDQASALKRDITKIQEGVDEVKDEVKSIRCKAEEEGGK